MTEFGITKPDDPSWPDFEQRLSFGIAGPGDAAGLQAAMQRAEKEIGGSPGRLFHLAVPTAAFTSMVGMLGGPSPAGYASVKAMVPPRPDPGW